MSPRLPWKWRSSQRNNLWHHTDISSRRMFHIDVFLGLNRHWIGDYGLLRLPHLRYFQRTWSIKIISNEENVKFIISHRWDELGSCSGAATDCSGSDQGNEDLFEHCGSREGCWYLVSFIA